jgi:hypothetical protein
MRPQSGYCLRNTPGILYQSLRFACEVADALRVVASLSYRVMLVVIVLHNDEIMETERGDGMQVNRSDHMTV